MKPGFMICQGHGFRIIAGFCFALAGIFSTHRVLAGFAAWAGDPSRAAIEVLAG